MCLINLTKLLQLFVVNSDSPIRRKVNVCMVGQWYVFLTILSKAAYHNAIKAS